MIKGLIFSDSFYYLVNSVYLNLNFFTLWDIGPDPVHAIDLIVNLDLYDAVFSAPPREKIRSGSVESSKICLDAAKILQRYV